MRINFKNFGLLEALVFLSLAYVVGMLIWTASTRPAVEAKANLVKENHKKVVDFINGEINNCGNNDEGKLTVWGDPCNGEWSSLSLIPLTPDAFLPIGLVLLSSNLIALPDLTANII